jgi:hypothetical protein
MRNLQIAAAVAATLAAVGVAEAAPPTLAQCAAPNVQAYVAGSSAAQTGFANALGTDLFGGAANLATYSASNGNFKAFCGFASATNTAGIAAGQIVVVHYRGEGGSVVGALPIVAQSKIKFLDLTSASVTSTAVATTGTSATVGTTDAWGGPLTTHAVEIGITDVEPGMFVGANVNYPSGYSTTVFGTATPAQLAGLPKSALFQQIFGIFVNTTGINGGAAGQPLNLSRDSIANILEGNYFDWQSVPTVGGGRVSSTSQAITVVNREAGSGSRGCGGTGTSAIADPTPANDGYATGDVLTTANATAGALTYASIDNAGSKPNLTTVSINGVAPSQLAATSGDYGFWVEAQLIPNATALAASTTSAQTIATYLPKILSTVGTAPHTSQVLAIPNIGTPVNTPAVPVVANAGTPGSIYINPFTRSGVSCNVASETN